MTNPVPRREDHLRILRWMGQLRLQLREALGDGYGARVDPIRDRFRSYARGGKNPLEVAGLAIVAARDLPGGNIAIAEIAAGLLDYYSEVSALGKNDGGSA